MIQRFGDLLFDPENILCGHLGADAWVELVKDGVIRREALDSEAQGALKMWIAAQDGERQYDELMERTAAERAEQQHRTDRWYSTTTWPPAGGTP